MTPVTSGHLGNYGQHDILSGILNNVMSVKIEIYIFFFFLSAFISPFTWSCHNTIHTLHTDIDVAVDNGI